MRRVAVGSRYTPVLLRRAQERLLIEGAGVVGMLADVAAPEWAGTDAQCDHMARELAEVVEGLQKARLMLVWSDGATVPPDLQALDARMRTQVAAFLFNAPTEG